MTIDVEVTAEPGPEPELTIRVVRDGDAGKPGIYTALGHIREDVQTAGAINAYIAAAGLCLSILHGLGIYLPQEAGGILLVEVPQPITPTTIH